MAAQWAGRRPQTAAHLDHNRKVQLHFPLLWVEQWVHQLFDHFFPSKRGRHQKSHSNRRCFGILWVKCSKFEWVVCPTDYNTGSFEIRAVVKCSCAESVKCGFVTAFEFPTCINSWQNLAYWIAIFKSFVGSRIHMIPLLTDYLKDNKKHTMSQKIE